MKVELDDIKQQVAAALAEDIGSGDITSSLINADQIGRGKILAREAMVVCGQDWVNACFSQCSQKIGIEWRVNEGDAITADTYLCDIHGPLAAILTAERTALNFLQTLSATATKTRQYVDALSTSSCQVIDTRKTIPGLRLAQKYAVTVGGGVNHRLGLFDAFLIKENHIQACASIKLAVAKAKQMYPQTMIEVEVETEQQLREALSLPVDRIMLDNFTLTDMRHAVKIRGSQTCPLEASGNINLENVKAVAETGVDFISVGALTKCIEAIDLSLRIEER